MSSPSTKSRARLRWWLGLIAVVGLQLGLFAYFGGGSLFSARPHAGLDFDTHITQAYRVVEGLEGWNRTWVYDVQLLAGAPNGVLFDADNKGWALCTYAGKQLGLPVGAAFNLFIVAAHLCVVPLVYVAARLFRLSPGAALVASGLAVLYWNFDSWSHWCWFVGMIAYGFASVFCLLPLGLFYRWTDEQKPVQLFATGIALAIAHLIHPYSFFILAVPMVLLYARAARSLSPRSHLGVVAVVATVLVVNGYWLANAVRFWHYILDSSFFAQTGPKTAVWDLLGLVVEPAATGIIGKRAGFRVVFLLAALVTAVIWWRRGDPRFGPLSGGLAVLLAIAYFGGLTPLSQIQPYRNVLPAGFFASICAAALLEHAVRERVFLRLSKAGRVMLALALIPASLFLVKDGLYYAIRDLPEPAPLPHGERVPMSSLGFPPHQFYGYQPVHADAVAGWLGQHDDRSGRVLVEGWSWGEHFAWKTKSHIIGGFIWRNLQHSWSNFFRQRPQGIARPADWQAYLQTYAVRWVVVSTPRSSAPWWDKNPALELVQEFGAFRIFRVREPVGYVQDGPGEVVATTNRIEVLGTDRNRAVTLRFHWLETLRCLPDCEIERVDVPGDPVGFIRVPAGHPEDFLVFNKYAFQK